VSSGTLRWPDRGVNAIGGNLTVAGGTAQWGNAKPAAGLRRVIVTSGTLDFNRLHRTLGSLAHRGGSVSNVPAGGITLTSTTVSPYILRNVNCRVQHLHHRHRSQWHRLRGGQ